MAGEDLRRRTRQLGLRVIEVVDRCPEAEWPMSSAGSSCAPGRPWARTTWPRAAPSPPADFISKMGSVEEALDESVHWVEVLVESRILRSDGVQELMRECDELLAITVSSINTARGKKRGKG